MKFLVKDLSRLTGLSAARIRKWQERFRILTPVQAENGYYYYDNDDLRILLNIQERLDAGSKLKAIVKLNRSDLLSSEALFNQEEWNILNAISRNQFRALESHLNDALLDLSLVQWIRLHVHPVILLTGNAWNKGILSVADEHAFSHWLHGYILARIEPLQADGPPIWLVATFPGDEHELGALLHYARLLYYHIPARFCGMLREEHLIKELKKKHYRTVSISLVIPRKPEEITRLRQRIRQETHVRRIHFGGNGYKRMMANAG